MDTFLFFFRTGNELNEAHSVTVISFVGFNWPNDILMKLPTVVTKGKSH